MQERSRQTSDPSRTGEDSDLAGKRDFLESGGAWPGSRKPECIETHASLIFLTEDRAWKMKKPVFLHHIDLRTLKAREHFCREEFRLNRELAADVYRDVVPIVQRPDGRYALQGPGEVVDWLVEMRRLPEQQMLDRRLVDGPSPDRREIADVGELLVRFYGCTVALPNSGDIYMDRLWNEAETNAAHLRAQWDRIGWQRSDEILGKGIEMLDAVRGEILERGAGGFLIEGHGDLRPEHVCLEEPPVVFDRVEFDHAMRLVDPFEEFNYLGLECALLGAGWIRDALLSILQRTDFPPPSGTLMTTYGVNRCLTRARLAIDHLLDADVRMPEKWPAQTRRYLVTAERLAGNWEGR